MHGKASVFHHPALESWWAREREGTTRGRLSRTFRFVLLLFGFIFHGFLSGTLGVIDGVVGTTYAAFLRGLGFFRYFVTCLLFQMISSRNIRLQKKKGVEGSQGQAAALLGEQDRLVVGKVDNVVLRGLVEDWAKDYSRSFCGFESRNDDGWVRTLDGLPYPSA